MHVFAAIMYGWQLWASKVCAPDTSGDVQERGMVAGTTIGEFARELPPLGLALQPDRKGLSVCTHTHTHTYIPGP